MPDQLKGRTKLLIPLTTENVFPALKSSVDHLLANTHRQ